MCRAIQKYLELRNQAAQEALKTKTSPQEVILDPKDFKKALELEKLTNAKYAAFTLFKDTVLQCAKEMPNTEQEYSDTIMRRFFYCVIRRLQSQKMNLWRINFAMIF